MMKVPIGGTCYWVLLILLAIISWSSEKCDLSVRWTRVHSGGHCWLEKLLIMGENQYFSRNVYFWTAVDGRRVHLQLRRIMNYNVQSFTLSVISSWTAALLKCALRLHSPATRTLCTCFVESPRNSWSSIDWVRQMSMSVSICTVGAHSLHISRHILVVLFCVFCFAT